MNWRNWVYTTLVGSSPVVATLPSAANILSSASIEGRPSSIPLLVIRMLPSAPALKAGAAHRQQMQLWAHDRDSSYLGIDAILGAARTALSVVVTVPGGICCEWLGDSGDLADDGMETITRYSSFNLVGTG